MSSSTTPVSHRILFWSLFAALAGNCLALGAAFAHLFELSAKMSLDRDAYFTVQQIYAGWEWMALAHTVQMIGLAVALASGWRLPLMRAPLIVVAGAWVAAQLVFWVFTWPANVQTAQWTIAPDSWAMLRFQWEYSHAVGAVCQFTAFIAAVVAALRFPWQTSPWAMQI